MLLTQATLNTCFSDRRNGTEAASRSGQLADRSPVDNRKQPHSTAHDRSGQPPEIQRIAPQNDEQYQTTGRTQASRPPRPGARNPLGRSSDAAVLRQAGGDLNKFVADGSFLGTFQAEAEARAEGSCEVPVPSKDKAPLTGAAQSAEPTGAAAEPASRSGGEMRDRLQGAPLADLRASRAEDLEALRA